VAAAGGGRGAVNVERVTQVAENEGRGFDFVRFAEACGAAGERVKDPKEIKAALRRAVESGLPYVVDIVMERETDCSMGVAIDAIREFE
jgi:thiamine pyrophosphate-dependent acetolactate synthase large subunit-like protein